MSAHRHPCVGDLTYGADPTLAKRLGLTRQWLHAVRLGFEHPGDGSWVEFESAYPARPAAGSRPGTGGERMSGTGEVGGPAGVVVRVVVDLADSEACFAVRKEVFVAEQGIAEDVEYDAYDAGAVHVIAVRADGIPLGTGRLLHGEAARASGCAPGVGLLGRLAVAQEARRLGVGAALVRGIEDAARERGLIAVELHAQTHALGFYERLGYVAYGAEYQEAGRAHQAMRRGF